MQSQDYGYPVWVQIIWYSYDKNCVCGLICACLSARLWIEESSCAFAKNIVGKENFPRK